MIFQLNLKMESLFSISSRHKNIVLNNRLLMSPQVEKKSIESIDFKCFSAGKEYYIILIKNLEVMTTTMRIAKTPTISNLEI